MLVNLLWVPLVPYTDMNEWWGLCVQVIITCCQSITQQVQNVQCQSQFSLCVIWTEYDKLMLGCFDNTCLHACCFETLLSCTQSRGAGWCRRVAHWVTHDATTALHIYLAEHGSHFCSACLLCPCIKQISGKMQCSVTALLVEEAFQKLMTVLFVYSDNEILWPQCLLPDIRTAVYMGQHTRLGADSPFMLIDKDIIAHIAAMSGIEPRSPAWQCTCLQNEEVILGRAR